VVSDLAQVHRASATRQFFGQQSEAADWLGRRGLRLRFRIGALRLRPQQFFRFMQQINAHSVLLLLGPLLEGVKKAAPTECVAWAAA